MFLTPLLVTADYNASKAAVISLHESLRYELDHKYHAPSVRTTLMVPGHIMTPLFSTVRLSQSWLFKFLVPSLAPITVAKSIIAALDDQHSQVIYAPFYVNFTLLLRLMPSFVRDFAQWVGLRVSFYINTQVTHTCVVRSLVVTMAWMTL